MFDVVRGQPHLLPAQQILSFHGPQLAHLGLAGSEFVDGGDGAEFDLEPLQSLDNFRHPFGRGARHGDNHFLQLQIHFVVQQSLRRADHRNVLHALSPFHAIVVKECDGLQTEVAPYGELLCQRRPDQTRADDSRASRALPGRAGRAVGATIARLAKRQTDGGQRNDGETEIGQYHAPRRRVIRA